MVRARMRVRALANCSTDIKQAKHKNSANRGVPALMLAVAIAAFDCAPAASFWCPSSWTSCASRTPRSDSRGTVAWPPKTHTQKHTKAHTGTHTGIHMRRRAQLCTSTQIARTCGTCVRGLLGGCLLLLALTFPAAFASASAFASGWGLAGKVHRIF